MLKSNIVLIGMPGCGKTTIGKMLSEKINYEFYDIDEYIEKQEQTSISAIFDKGEENFRDIEEKYVKEVALKNGIVISTGGGVIKRIANIENLKKNGVIVFIDRPIENILSDIDTDRRPLLKDKKSRIYNLYNERYDLYMRYCNERIINKGSINEVIEEIKYILEER